MESPEPLRLLSMSDAAVRADVAYPTIRYWVLTGRLRVHAIAGKCTRLFTADDVDAAIRYRDADAEVSAAAIATESVPGAFSGEVVVDPTPPHGIARPAEAVR